MKSWVVVIGNIGTGKSSLLHALQEELGWDTYDESDEQPNPYLSLFYDDMPRWAFHSQMHFLGESVRAARTITRRSVGAAQDRSMYDHYHVFSKDLYQTGKLSEDEWNTISNLYYAVEDLLPAPDLLIYCQAPVAALQERIEQRGRGFEQHITIDDLQRLHNHYEALVDVWTRSPVLTVSSDQYDWRTDEGRDHTIQAILDALN